MNSPDRFDHLYDSDDPSDREELLRRAGQDPDWQSRLNWESAVRDTARSLRPALPDLFPAIQARRAGLRRRRWLLAVPAAAAAALWLFSVWFQVPDPPAQPGTGLLSDADLQRAQNLEQSLRQQASAFAPAPDRAAQLSPAGEQVALLDDAIRELRTALDLNPKHRHLRERLHELTRQRLGLLSELSREQGI